MAATTLVVVAGCCATVSACHATSATVSSREARCPHDGNEGLALWRCWDRANRYQYVDIHTTAAATRNELRRTGRDSVVITESRLKGVIDFSAATAITLDGDSGLILIPIRLDDGQWVAVIWTLRGEFEAYGGIEDLTEAALEKIGGEDKRNVVRFTCRGPQRASAGAVGGPEATFDRTDGLSR